MDQDDRQLTELEQANVQLRASLKQCQDMVADYRLQLVAKANLPTDEADQEADPAG